MTTTPPIELHDYERTDWVYARHLLPGDQLGTGHIVTNVDDSLISHIRVVCDGDVTDVQVVPASQQVTVIRPAAEPQGHTNRLRERVPIALPATTPADPDVVCSCGKDCHTPAGLASHQRASGHNGRANDA